MLPEKNEPPTHHGQTALKYNIIGINVGYFLFISTTLQ
jgi:hypothetical protein